MNTKKAVLSALMRGSSALSAIGLASGGAAVLALATTPAFAQDYTNVTASGRVQSTAGQPVGGATVTIKSNDQGFSRTVTTNPDGSFQAPQLPQGSYTFTIAAPDFDTLIDSTVTLDQRNAANEFTLKAAGEAAGGEIVVTGRRAIVDFNRTTTGAVINIGELATRIPVARDLTSVVLLAPGTTQGDTAFGNLPSIAGSSVAENVYYVNGLNLTDFRKGLGSVTVPFEFYETVETKNGGYQAEFGRSTGGVINATTKSGSNEFHAGAVISYEPNGLRERAPNTYIADNDGDYGERLDANFYASGPLVKDRLFFYGLYNPRYSTFGDGGELSHSWSEDQTKSPFYGGKLDFVIADGHRLEATYFNTEGTTTRKFNDYDPDTNEIGTYNGKTLFETGGQNYVARYTGSFTDWLTLSAAYGKNKNRASVLSDRPDYPYVQDSRDGSLTPLANLTIGQERNQDTREFYRADADVYFEALGSHHVRFGYDREDLTSDAQNDFTGGAFYDLFPLPNGSTRFRDNGQPLPPGAEYVTVRTFENLGLFTSQNQAFYIQDNWSLFDDRLVLQLGLRNDRFVNRNAEGDAFYRSGNQWGPRLGVSFDPTGDRSTKLYGSYGRYFLPIAANTNLRLAGAEYDVTSYHRLLGINPDGTPILGNPLTHPSLGACIRTTDLNCSVVSDGELEDTASQVAGNLKPQSMDEFILGAERRLSRNVRVGLYGTYRKLNRALEDVAIDQAVNAYCIEEFGPGANDRVTGIAGCREYRGFHQYVLVNPGSDALITLADRLNGEAEARTVLFTAEQLGYPKARRTYKAITAEFDRAFDGIWSLAGSYTWSKTKGNYEGAVKSDNGQDDAGITTDFDQPGLIPGSYGYLPGDRRHNFKLFGSYQVMPWLLVGANFQAVSPRSFGCIGYIDPSIDPYAGAYGAAGNYCPMGENGQLDPSIAPADFVVVPRGSAFKSDWMTTTNMSFSVNLPSEIIDAQLRFDVFNLFNQKAALDFNELGTDDQGGINPNYRKPTAYQAPRSVRVQLGLRF